jgi:hypothetical protein
MIPVLNFCILLFQDKSINENHNLLKNPLSEHGTYSEPKQNQMINASLEILGVHFNF